MTNLISLVQNLFYRLGRKLLNQSALKNEEQFSTIKPFTPNPIVFVITHFPDGCTAEEREVLKTVFMSNVLKVGGFGGVYRAVKTAEANPDKPIEFFSTHRPYLTIRELPKRALELGLNAIADKYIAGHTYDELCASSNSIGLLAYEIDEEHNGVVDAWEMPAVYWSRTDMDGRHDPRLLYIDLAGKVLTGDDVLSKARIYHGGEPT